MIEFGPGAIKVFQICTGRLPFEVGVDRAAGRLLWSLCVLPITHFKVKEKALGLSYCILSLFTSETLSKHVSMNAGVNTVWNLSLVVRAFLSN